MTDQVATRENVGHDNAGREIARHEIVIHFNSIVMLYK